MSEEPKKRLKRGRPAKNPEKRQRTRSDSQSSSANQEPEPKPDRPKVHNKALDSYYDLHTNFTKEGISQQSQHLIRKITSSPSVPSSIKSAFLLSVLNTVTQEFLMNELEIVVLSIYLEKFAWFDRNTDSYKTVKFAAYAVKNNLSEDIYTLNAFVNFKYPEFIQEFLVWQESFKQFMAVNPRDLNDRFKELSKAASLPGDTKIMDYNTFVDEILQYNPHMLYDKPQLDEIMNDPECLEFIKALKSNKKIVTKDNQEVPLSLLKKAENVFGEIVQDVKEESDETVFVANPLILQKIESFAEGNIKEKEEDDEDDD